MITQFSVDRATTFMDTTKTMLDTTTLLAETTTILEETITILPDTITSLPDTTTTLTETTTTTKILGGKSCLGKDKKVTLERISSNCGVSFYYKQRSNVLSDLLIMHLIGSKDTCEP